MKITKLENNLNDSVEVIKIQESHTVVEDFITSLCGEIINSGCYRNVYVCNFDIRCVIKVEPRNTYCNINEFQVWSKVNSLGKEFDWVKKWFAPVHWISPNGRLLVMTKTNPFHKNKKKERPKRVPSFLWDVKESNFGWIGDNYVCHDYGHLYNLLDFSKKTVAMDWDKDHLI